LAKCNIRALSLVAQAMFRDYAKIIELALLPLYVGGLSEDA